MGEAMAQKRPTKLQIPKTVPLIFIGNSQGVAMKQVH